MDAQKRLGDAIEQQEKHLRANVPVDRVAASVAVVEAIDRRHGTSTVLSAPAPDLITGRHFSCYGGSKAIRFCVQAEETGEESAGGSVDAALSAWADGFLVRCDHLAAAESVLRHVESGFMRLFNDGEATVAAWRATRLAPASWRERADIDWWAAWLAQTTDADRLMPLRP